MYRNSGVIVLAQCTGLAAWEALTVVQLGRGACKDVMYRCCGVIVFAQCTGLAA